MKTRSSDDPLLPSWVLRAVIVGALAVLAGAATPPGAALAGGAQSFLSYYAGVFTLLALTAAVVFGLLATDRLILGIRQRVVAQAAHRAASVLAFTFVVAHLLVKVLGGLAAPAQIVVPAVGPVGLGTLAFDLLLVVLATGALRARFARRARPWVWRTLHSLAYVSWPLGIAHGLTAGRAAAPWVTLSYVLCLGAVALAVLTRSIAGVRPRQVRRAGEDVAAPAPLRTRGTAPAARAAGARGEAVR
ncbi:hypothetical protein [Actinomadura parmotrematis]|uniref:Ferric reductase n=1 Tax=Actinomadura parmotrematis TaxID=2864039 RepID=A0ABS7FKF8_9ACTN|nr:hypothetical protein [Actinomadura parmotrematis]MBW8480862.1 hypothetical protein [Actinomadura parmotrematis]